MVLDDYRLYGLWEIAERASPGGLGPALAKRVSPAPPPTHTYPTVVSVTTV